MNVWAGSSGKIQFGLAMDGHRVLPLSSDLEPRGGGLCNKLLPKQVRPPLWRNICLVGMAAFFAFLTIALVGKQTGWWKI
jgi:hypothetical protein